jgi:hypothetical protein
MARGAARAWRPRRRTKFDASLNARDPRWGLRRVRDLDAAADARAFARTRLVEMPANKLMMIYRR